MHTIFFKYITCLDHAYIDDEGKIKGGSFHVSVNVSSKSLDDSDHTVIDFSSGKKIMKNLIDDMIIGYDHKCWVIPGWSNIKHFDGEVLETESTTIKAPKTAFRVFDFGESYFQINQELENFLMKNMPGFDIDVMCEEYPFALDGSTLFSYVHGLKTSKKSLGCQNIAHGHLSFISVSQNPALQNRIADELNESIFIFSENIVSASPNKICLKYTTTERGTFYLEFDPSTYKYQILDTETTIENIAQWVAGKYNTPSGKLVISEGLSKGSIV